MSACGGRGRYSGRVPTDADRSVTLRQAASDYHRRRVTLLRLAPAVAAVGARIACGRFRRSDGVVALAVLLGYGPLEWAAHRVALHGGRLGPLQGDGDSPPALAHRDHHEDADDLDRLFVPLEVVPVSVVAATVGAIVVSRRTTVPLSGLAAGLALMATYHWVHYLIHAPYRPRTTWLRDLEENHRAHHDGSDPWRMGVLFSTMDSAAAHCGPLWSKVAAASRRDADG